MLPQVGALVEGPAAYPHLSGRRNLALFDAMAPDGDRRTRRGRVADALEQVGLAAVDERPVRAYSLGMRQRLGLAGALLRGPRLLVLDEPTNGLDPQGIREIRELLLDLNRAGTTVFLSSHLLGEIEQLCTRVGVLDRGGWSSRRSSRSCAAHRAGRGAHPRRRAVRRLLDGVVEETTGSGSWSASRTRPRSTRGWCGPGIRVTRLGAERHTLEEVVLAATTESADRFGVRRELGGPVIRVELVKLVLGRRTWATIALIDALPALVAVLLAVTDLGPRPGTGPAFLSAVLTDGTLFPLAALGIVLPLFLPIAVAITAGEAIAGEAQQGTLRYMLVRPVGRTRLLGAKLVAVMAFVVLTVLVVAATAYVLGILLLGDENARPPGPPASPAARCRRRSSWAAPSWRSATRCSACSGWRRSRCSCPR